MKLLRSIVVLLTLSPSLASAGDDNRQRQVDAARIAAQVKIVDLIADEPLGRGLTVGGYLDRMDARKKLWQTVSAARQVGGVRWIDDGTCQVRVEVAAVDIGQLLLDTALAAPNKSPLSYDLLEQRAAQWAKRSFSATAGSLAPDRAVLIAAPNDRGGWSAIQDAQRRAMIDAARANAGARLADTFFTTSSDDETARAKLVTWASSQPVTAVQFRDDRAVDVTIAYSAAELAQAVRDASPGFQPAELDHRLEAAPPTVTGSSRIETVAPARQVVVIPAQPPGWVNDLLDVTADAPFKSSALKTARRADDAAQQQLRGLIESLVFEPSATIGERAKDNPAIAAAVERALSASKVAKVEYRADGSVAVRLVLPGKTVWSELAGVAPARR